MVIMTVEQFRMNEWLVKRKYLEETCSDAALSTTDPA
jgi:hypothetical protein